MIDYVKQRETRAFVVFVTNSKDIADFQQKLYVPKKSVLAGYKKITLKGEEEDELQD